MAKSKLLNYLIEIFTNSAYSIQMASTDKSIASGASCVGLTILSRLTQLASTALIQFGFFWRRIERWILRKFVATKFEVCTQLLDFSPSIYMWLHKS